MGCGISIFEHSQRNAKEYCHKQNVGVHHCSIIPKNTTTITTSASYPFPPPTTITLSSPSKVVSLGFSTKSPSSLIHGGGDHQDLQPRPEPDYHPTNECLLPPPLQHTNNDEVTDDDHSLADGDGGINLVLLHRLGAVLDPDLEETKSTKDVNHNDDATTSAAHHHHRNNNSERDEQQEVGAKIPDYDGPLWIASPSFREYCIADSDSDDSFKAAAGNQSREMIENKMQRPKDNVTLSDEDSGIIHQASGTRRVKKTRSTVGKVLTMRRPKAAVFKNFFSNSKLAL